MLTHRARAARFVEPDQADANSPVLLAKIFLFPLDPNQIYKPRHPVPLEGRIARRHERGAGCGGRGSVGRAIVIAGRVQMDS